MSEIRQLFWTVLRSTPERPKKVWAEHWHNTFLRETHLSSFSFPFFSLSLSQLFRPRIVFGGVAGFVKNRRDGWLFDFVFRGYMEESGPE